MYDHSLNRERKYFCRYCLQDYWLKHHIEGCFKINGKQRIKMPKKGEYVEFKNLKKKTKIVYSDFDSILVPEDNGNHNAEECYTDKYQKYVACSYGYK